MRLAYASLFTASAVVAGFLSFPNEANAGWRVFHPSSCRVACEYTGCNGQTQYSPSYFSNDGNGQPGAAPAGQVTNENAGALIMLCPVVTDNLVNLYYGNYHPVAYVSGYANGSASHNVWLRACRTYAAGGGGVCGTPVTPANNNAVYTAQITDTSSWQGSNTIDGLYLDVILNAQSNGSNSPIFSYWATNGQ